MSTRRLLVVMLTICALAVTAGASVASAASREFFNQNIVLSSYAVSGTPRSNLYAGGGSISSSGSWTFCAAYNPNGTEVLDDYTCAAGSGFIETFGTVAARAWIEVKHKSGSEAAHVIGEEFWE